MVCFGAALGVLLLYLGLGVMQPWLDSAYGLFIPITVLSVRDLLILCAVVVAAAVVSLLPALRAYRMSLADGMSVKI